MRWLVGQNDLVRCVWILAAWMIATIGSAAPRPDGPNIILITADCITFDRLGSYGSKVAPLSEVDRLANGGARFENFYVSPGESVTTVTLLTGRYPFRHGWMWHNDVERWGPPSLSADREITLARMLRDRGYRTAIAGKWLLNDLKKEPKALKAHGFQQVKQPVTESINRFVRGSSDQPFFLYARLADASVNRVDSLVGDLVKTLDETKLNRQTIILITNEAIGGGSHSLREPQIKTPLIIYGTHRVRKGVIKSLVDFSDLFPTVLELTGTKPPRGRVIDGRSFAPQLRGDAGNPREWVFTQYGTDRILSNWQYKLYSNGRFYNLLSDPNEEYNLARTSVSEVVAEKERLQRLLKAMPADKPLNFPYARRLRIRKR